MLVNNECEQIIDDGDHGPTAHQLKRLFSSSPLAIATSP